MKEVKMMILSHCPHCKEAFRMMDSLKDEHPEYRDVEVEVIDEEKEMEKTEGFDYWFVPTIFVGKEKIMEGVPQVEEIEMVFKKALSS